VNVLIGANGSGKTALLEAIGMLSAATSGTVDDESLQRRGVRLGIPQLYKSSFKDINAKHIDLSMQYGNTDEMWHYSVELGNPNENPELAWIYQKESLNLNNKLILQHKNHKVDIYGSGGIKLAVSQTKNTGGNLFLDFLRHLKSYAIYAPSTPMLCDVVTDTRTSSTRFPLGLSGNRLAEAMQPLIDVENETYGHLDLDEVLDLLDWIDSIAVVPPTAEILSPHVSLAPDGVCNPVRNVSLRRTEFATPSFAPDGVCNPVRNVSLRRTGFATPSETFLCAGRGLQPRPKRFLIALRQRTSSSGG
jgi:energy-coupling factor transporter ATP-binding protein EcfA2